MCRFLPFAALLGVALVLGCQDVATGPDGLVPQFAVDCSNARPNHPKCPDSDPDPDPDPPPPRIAVCCSQNRFSENAAQQIAEGLAGGTGTYRTLKAKQFNEMTPEQLAGN